MSSSSSSESQIAQLRSTSPHVLFFIARSKNKNIVVYEALLGHDKELRKDKPVDVYWLDLDPAYQEKKRKKGIASDREELGTIEKQFAYGVSWTLVDGHKYHLKLVALPDREVFLVWDSAHKVAHCTIPINGKSAWLERVYVDSTDSYIGLPKVNYVIIEGVDPETKAHVSEKIIPK